MSIDRWHQQSMRPWRASSWGAERSAWIFVTAFNYPSMITLSISGILGRRAKTQKKKTGGDNFLNLAWCYRSQFHEQAIADEVNLTLISSFNLFSVQHASLIIHYVFIMRVVNYEATSGWKSCNDPVKYIIKLLPRLNFVFIIYLLVRSLRKIWFYIKINCWKEISQQVQNRRM